MIDASLIEGENARRAADLAADYDALGARLARRGVDIEALTGRAMAFRRRHAQLGHRHRRHPLRPLSGRGRAERHHGQAGRLRRDPAPDRATPRVSLHIPWDKADPADLLAKAEELGLGFDAMNSNTFQDQPDHPLSYKYGSLSHTDAATRQQAIEHNLECIEIGRAIGSKALTVWIGDGSNFPGQTSLTRSSSTAIWTR
jgi:L-rhamnose isomerase/sugar isomerase